MRCYDRIRFKFKISSLWIFDSKMVLDLKKLIRLVQERRSLWCHSSPHYKDNNNKKLLWDDIGRKLNICGLTAKTKWRSLRNIYARQCIAMSQSSGKKFVRWQYYQDMAFLRPELQFRSTMQRLQPLTKEKYNVTCLDNETVMDPASPPQTQEIPTLAKNERHINISSDNRSSTANLEYENGKTELGREQAISGDENSKKSSNYYFLNSLVDPLDSLPLEMQLHIKERYTYLLHSALRAHHNITLTPSNTD